MRYATLGQECGCQYRGWRHRLKQRFDATIGRRRGKAALVVMMASAILVGCAEEGAGPQFASDPRPTSAPTATVAAATPAPLPTAPVIATPVSVSDLLMSRGAPPGIYLVDGDAVWSLTSGGDAKRILAAPSGARVAAIATAPSATRVAVLLAGDDDARQTEVVVLDAAGSIESRVQGFTGDVGTPTPGFVAGEPSLDWSPQGDRILVSLHGGAVYTLPVGQGEAAPDLVLGRQAGGVLRPTWSPTGESIAYIAVEGEERRRSLRILDVTTGEETVAVPENADRFVVEFAWMPDGASLLFTESGSLGGATTGVDLWRVAASGEDRALVASAGAVAPVARITDIRPSPDGRSVAYAVLTPGAGGPRPDSVWVRDLGARDGFRINLPLLESVTGIWWTDRGLLVSALSGSNERARRPSTVVLRVDPAGAVSVLWTSPAGAGTPVAATPRATPLGS